MGKILVPAIVREEGGDTGFPTLEQIHTNLIGPMLDGSDGSNRAPIEQCQLQARNDYEAIHAWLREYRDAKETVRLYKKESERLLLWAVFQRKKALSSLTRDNIDEYLDFLINPQPRDLWCGKSGGRHGRRGTANWKPFVKPLKASSQRTVLAVIGSLFSYLTDARYLNYNPLALMRKKRSHMHSIEERKLGIEKRTLSMRVWAKLLDTLDTWEDGPKNHGDKIRLRWMIHILYFLGIRNNELEQHTFSAFHCVEYGEDEEKWWFIVRGKGKKLNFIPIHDDLLSEMQTYRDYLGLPKFPSASEQTPLIHSTRSEGGIGARQVNNILKKLATATAHQYFSDEPTIFEQLKGFSAHWLRHQSGTEQHRSGIDPRTIQANLGHSSSQSTDIYIHKFDNERHAETQKMSLRPTSFHEERA